MNERIRELAEQAGLEFDDDESLEFGKQIYYVTKEDMEKFAELIVTEMYVFMCNSTDNHKPWPSFKKVKAHFGVEE